MKNIIRLFICAAIILSCFLTYVPTFAIEGTSVNLQAVVSKSFNVRGGPGTNQADIGDVTVGQSVTISQYTRTNDGSTGCETGIWFYVTNYSGWVCSNGLSLTNSYNTTVTSRDIEQMNEAQFEQYLIAEGFPTSYWASLKGIHAKHPNWLLRGVNTYRVWENTITDEAEPGMSTYYITSSREAAGHEAYLNTDVSEYYNWSTNMFYGYDGWGFLANKQTVAHFIDPRNFLDEVNLFMFQDQFYIENTKNASLVEAILGTSAYTSQIIAAAKDTNISPVALASRIKQEGTIGRAPTQGLSVNCSADLRTYIADGIFRQGPLYNFYNVGAHAGGTNAQYNGLCYASIEDASTLRPWNTIDKALKGGAMFIGSSYIYRGQYSTYFQKFNVAPSSSTTLGHQYMTNIEDPSNTATIMYNQYKNADSLNADFVFYIPYYFDMPNELATLPTLGNPNNWLSSIKINGNSVNEFSGDKTDYSINVDKTTTSITIDTITTAKTSYVSINGNTKTLKTGTSTINISNTTTDVNIVVTSGNGAIKNYKVTVNRPADDTTTPPPEKTKLSINTMISNVKLNLQNNFLSGVKIGTTSNNLKSSLLNEENTATISIKSSSGTEKTDHILSTGDIITISSNNETKAIELVIYGDVNGDSTLSIKDLLLLQKHILGDSNLTNSYLKASDVNKDGNTTIKDLLEVQKSILGDGQINQL